MYIHVLHKGVQMGWNGQVGMHISLVCTWNVPWCPSVPLAIDGRGWTGRNSLRNSSLEYTWDVIWCPSVPHVIDGAGWTGQNSSLVYTWDVPWDPIVPHGTGGMGYTCISA